MRKVLVFPAGTEIGLEIYSALHSCKEVELFAAGQAISNHAELLYDNYHQIPSIHSDQWLDELISVVKKLDIDYIFPAYDDVIVALSANREKIPATILIPSHEICLLTRSKSETYQKLKSVVKTPKVYKDTDDVVTFPVFIKPDKGQGSFGIKLVKSREELQQSIEEIESPIISEYLPGNEYTVDCFSDREKGLLFSGARQRLRMRNGIAVSTQIIESPIFNSFAQKISDELSMQGAWFFQVKEDINSELTLLEIGPRIAGSMAANRVQGVNFPLLSIFEAERLPLSILKNSYPVLLDRALKNKYKKSIDFDSVYVDFDDTILLGSQINLQVIQFLYKCVNKGIEIILITRHAGDLSKTLSKYRLNHLFDKIIHLKKDEKKSSAITHKNAIFIDDSFSERRDVQKVKKIPTFDCSMMEFLLDQ
ncbi:ATP-grasp domain-containing protein [Polynucleobacter nymphae]|uniref:ATP-grasp domain-containing protein n=1 Tax=Polynucleobacter nymphae TaxID=2081043 RepID=UPI001C0C764E|nr:ATP-grasp domain-containing protein [Polynucleobacter nymphae]MBU3607868.1 ATP-grasp domain-containing protein [Polynucleobacter nymphae]